MEVEVHNMKTILDRSKVILNFNLVLQFKTDLFEILHILPLQ